MERGGYVRFSAAGLTAGTGYYVMDPGQVARYRRAVDDDTSGAELVAVIGRLTAKHLEIHGTNSLKRPPKGYAADHPRVDLLRHKGLIAWREWPAAAWLATPAARKRVQEFLRTAAPLRGWLDKHVGPGES
jgi:uncharacterized protein (DUF2461 family)